MGLKSIEKEANMIKPENKPIYSKVSLTTYFALNTLQYHLLPETHAGALVKWLAIPSVMPEFEIRFPLSVFSKNLLNVCSPLIPKVFIVGEASVAETTYMVCSISDQHCAWRKVLYDYNLHVPGRKCYMIIISMCLEESVI